MSILEDYIADSMEETMLSYTTTEAYISKKKAINRQIADFRSNLSESQQKTFNSLIDMIDAANAEFAAKAYATGVVNGILFRQDITKIE